MGRRSPTDGGRIKRDGVEPSDKQFSLLDFEEPPLERSRVKLRPLKHPIWTENKAKLIARYLFYFELITKHGTYIDGFAGPQDPSHLDAWAARLVLEMEPRWFRNFFLCDAGTEQFEALKELRDAQPPRKNGEPKRTVRIYHNDFNIIVGDILSSGMIKETEATFCLLDQRTFECKWATVERLARHKQNGNKIELFYFLCAWWFGRAFQATMNEAVLADWWGRADWAKVGEMKDRERADTICDRLRNELGYKHALAWPIYSKANGGRIAYYMIHASDHDEAPKLMHRAYRFAVIKKETAEQLGFAFDDTAGGAA